MTDSRRELISLVEKLGDLHPDMRFGQLITNLAYWAIGPKQGAAWDATDDELIDAAIKHINKRS